MILEYPSRSAVKGSEGDKKKGDPSVEIEVVTTRYFLADDGTRRAEYDSRGNEWFDSAEDLAAWLILGDFEDHFSGDTFDPDGFWSTPAHVHTISGMHEKASAHPVAITPECWRFVYDQMQTVQTV